MSLKAVIDEPNPQPEICEPQPGEPLAIRMPVDVRSIALTVLAGLAIVLALQYAQAMVIPIVLGVLISYALEPIVAWMTRWHVPRALAAGIVLVTLVGVSGSVLYVLRGQASAIVEQLPQGARRLRQMVENDPSIGAIVCECTNITPYSHDLRREAGVPVFDMVTLVHWFHRALRPQHFPQD